MLGKGSREHCDCVKTALQRGQRNNSNDKKTLVKWKYTEYMMYSAQGYLKLYLLCRAVHLVHCILIPYRYLFI